MKGYVVHGAVEKQGVYMEKAYHNYKLHCVKDCSDYAGDTVTGNLTEILSVKKRLIDEEFGGIEQLIDKAVQFEFNKYGSIVAIHLV